MIDSETIYLSIYLSRERIIRANERLIEYTKFDGWLEQRREAS